MAGGRDKESSVQLVAKQDTGPAILLKAIGGKGLIGLTIEKDKNPAIALFDKNGDLRSVLGGTEITSPTSSLVFLGEDGTVIWKAP